MGTDVWIVLQWWGMLFLVGAVAFPLTKALFGRNGDAGLDQHDGRYWWDHGYLFSKAVGMAVVTWIVYVLGTVRIFPFTIVSIVFSLVLVFLLGFVFNFQYSIFNFHSKLQITNYKLHKLDKQSLSLMMLIVLEELFFLGALFFWSWVKGHEPSIHGLEKFMDFGFMKSIFNSSYFPPADMWYAGFPINYYYFGHMVVAVLTKLSGLDLSYTFNLMLASIFALTFTMSFSIGKQLLRIRGIGGIGAIGGGLLTAFLVTLAGNMQTLYAFTKGYTGDAVKPFWTLLWGIREMGGIEEIWGKLGEGLNRYWYANATRFIPYTIHEFPSYSFVVSDVHGHVLSLPFTLLAIALLIAMLDTIQLQKNFQFPIFNFQSIFNFNFQIIKNSIKISNFKFQIIFYGFLVGVLLMTNALDGPIYLALLIGVLGIFNFPFGPAQGGQFSIFNWKTFLKQISLVTLVAVVTSLPFLFHFKSFVTGIALNCPPAFLADSKIGPFLFESVEKCQHSPLWMMWLLWGFFVYCGIWLISTKLKIKTLNLKLLKQTKSYFEFSQIEKLLVVFFLFSLALIIFPEFFYFKDIYPAHFRSNTMFKLGYQAFILFSIVAGYTIVSSFWQAIRLSRRARPESHGDAGRARLADAMAKRASMTRARIFLLFIIPQLFLVSIFPIFSVRSYFDSLRNYKGLNGLAWLEEQYPDDYEAIKWLDNETEKGKRKKEKGNKGLSLLPFTFYRLSLDRFAIVEADGDSYTDHARISAFTGLPTIIGWPVHEWLWRGSYDEVAPRREVVRKIYESEDIEETKDLLKEYNVSYIIVGTLERQKFQNINEDKLQLLGQIVFQQGETTIYRVDLH